MNDRFGHTPEEQKALQAAIEAANVEAMENWDNQAWRREMAQAISEEIYRGFQHENLVSLIAETQSVDWNGRVFQKEVRGLRAFWIARGGYIEASDMHAEVFEIPRDMIGFHVFEMEDKVMADFAETQANLIDLGTQRLDAEINARVLRMFQAAIPDTSPYYIDGAGLDLPSLNLAIREVRDASRQRDVAIVGRSPMVGQIVDQLAGSEAYPAFLPTTNEELLRSGVLGTYKGARIVELVNYLDDTNTPFFPANELYVIAKDASKFAFFGGLKSHEWTEDEVDYWHYRTRREFGGVIHRPDRLRRIVDTDITPLTVGS